MDKEAIAKELNELAASSKRSKTAKLRDVIDDVEKAIKAGVPRYLIVEILKKNGLEMSLNTFESTLQRIRKADKKIPTSKTKENTKIIEDTEPEHVETSNDPADLDKIIRNAPDLDALAKLYREK